MKTTYFIEVGGCKQYYTYDADKQEATSKFLGVSANIPSEKFFDFFATARVLGLKAGKV